MAEWEPEAYAVGLLPHEIDELTPGEIMGIVKARQKQEMVRGWWAERFRKERRLKPLSHYWGTEKKKPVEEARMDYAELKSTLGR